jgi:alpha-tubulin suppressor-like RCC1 family protein
LAQKQSSQNIYIPAAPKSLKGITKQIVSARSHTALLTTEGKIYVCGSLLFGRLGIPTKTAKVNNYREFRPLNDRNLVNQRIVKLACGDFHTLALTDNGLIYSWGGTLWDKTGHKT